MMVGLVRCALAVLSLVAINLASPVHAQSFPSKTLTIVVPIGAGTGMDVLARLYGDKLSAALGQPVVVENRPGAATMLAATQIAAAPPDGHTMVILTSGALAINPALYKKINYDHINAFTPISLYVKSPMILVVNPKLPIKTAAEFVNTPRKPRRRSAMPRSAPARSSTCAWSTQKNSSASTLPWCPTRTPGSR
jgi:tripartite-type tricarboxylate transporter receptor subunit TctC